MMLLSDELVTSREEDPRISRPTGACRPPPVNWRTTLCVWPENWITLSVRVLATYTLR